MLDHIVWRALAGDQAHFAVGEGGVRRYAPGFSPIVAFQDPAHPDFSTLARYCAPGEVLYFPDWDGAVPDGWERRLAAPMLRMVWEGTAPPEDTAHDAVALGPEHAEQAVALASLTRPGPFGPRTLELGEYFGYFDGARLIAMAGERFYAGVYREISGVCTHPDYQGRGLARRLMQKLLYRQVQRGEVPFLHVMQENTAAVTLYETLGFVLYRVCSLRVLASPFVSRR